MFGIRDTLVSIAAFIMLLGAPVARAQHPDYFPAPAASTPSQPNAVRPAAHTEMQREPKPAAAWSDDLPLSLAKPSGENAKRNSPLAAMASVVFSLAAVLGLFLVIAWLMRRGMPAAARSLPSEAVEVLGRTPLAGRQQMHLVRFGNKLLLVCVSPEGANSLSEVTDPAEIEHLTQLCGSKVSLHTKKTSSTIRQVALSLAIAFSLFGTASATAQETPAGSAYPVTAAHHEEPAKILAGGRVSAEPLLERSSNSDVVPEKSRGDAHELAYTSAPLEGLSPGNWTSPEGISSTLKVLLTMGALSLAPALVLMTTCFVRIVIVLGLLRQALGTQQLPPNQVMTAAALFLTLLIMWPTWKQTYEEAVVPYSERKIDGEEAWQRGSEPIRRFMAAQIKRAGNDDDVLLFYKYLPEGTPQPKNYGDVPLVALAPAFLLSELKTAFLIGFQIFLPFIVIDLVVSSITVAMGMMMLPPAMIALPFKLLLFVLVDGWHLVAEMLLQSFQQ